MLYSLHGLLQLLKISSAIGGKGVAAIHESVDENSIGIQPVLLRHFQQRMKMGLIRMHTAVRKQAKKMQAASADLRILHGFEQERDARKNSPFWIINSMRVLSM